ncbi:MAG: lysine--tRNA ligase [Candidatus Micrarchaeota archaeon]|nr:lysine--tRNA ligase [Candidatus Micrarchaeota archaeon]
MPQKDKDSQPDGQADSKRAFHWSELLAQQIISEKPEPYIISGGLTTSGPTHLGTVCEFLFPQAIVDSLHYLGKQAKYYFVADIYDAFDGVPSIFEQYKSILEPHLGKPLTAVPDPTGKTASFGDYFLADAVAAMGRFGVKPEIVRATDLYSKGAMDKCARLFLKEENKVKEIVAKSSLRDSLPDWWSPIMPLCEKCSKIATTRVLSHDGENYEYACDRDVKYTKGCGYVGKAKISDHKYKLTWRLHWPAWQEYFQTSAEGGGVDHFTRGGSRDTLEVIFRDLFKKEPPIGYKWGFILFEGKKYSKSKGTGMGVTEMLDVIPIEVMKYMLLKPDIQENVDINPTPLNVLRTIEDYEKALAMLAAGNFEALSRADYKRVIAAKLASEGASGGRGWKTPFLDVLLYRNLQWSWEQIIEKTGDKVSIQKLTPYIEAWERKNFIPEEYAFSYKPQKAQEKAAVFFTKLQPSMPALDMHNLVFSTAAELSIPPGKMFEECYLALLGKAKGPKLGKLIEAIGIEKVKKDVL